MKLYQVKKSRQISSRTDKPLNYATINYGAGLVRFYNKFIEKYLEPKKDVNGDIYLEFFLDEDKSRYIYACISNKGSKCYTRKKELAGVFSISFMTNSLVRNEFINSNQIKSKANYETSVEEIDINGHIYFRIAIV